MSRGELKRRKEEKLQCRLAFCMAMHKRLGEESPARILPREIMRHIFKYVVEPLPIAFGDRLRFHEDYLNLHTTIDWGVRNPKPPTNWGLLHRAIEVFLEGHCDQIRTMLLERGDDANRDPLLYALGGVYAAGSKMLVDLCRPFEGCFRYSELQSVSDMCSAAWLALVSEHDDIAARLTTPTVEEA